MIVRDPEERDVFRQMLKNEQLGDRERLKLMPSLNHAIDKIADKEGMPLIVGTDDVPCGGSRHWLEVKRLILEKGGAVLFLLSKRNEAGNRDFDRCDVFMSPLQKGTLPFMGKTAAILDRFLGSR